MVFHQSKSDEAACFGMFMLLFYVPLHLPITPQSDSPASSASSESSAITRYLLLTSVIFNATESEYNLKRRSLTTWEMPTFKHPPLKLSRGNKASKYTAPRLCVGYHCKARRCTCHHFFQKEARCNDLYQCLCLVSLTYASVFHPHPPLPPLYRGSLYALCTG